MKRLLVLACLLASPFVWATNPALVGSGGACVGHFNTTDETCNYTIGTSGDLVAVVVDSYAGADWTPVITAGKVPSFTASGNNNAVTAGGAGKFQALFFGKSNASGADTITCGKGGGTVYCSIMVFTFSNTSSPTEDKFSNASGTSTGSTLMDSGTTASTTAAVEILIGCGYNSSNNSSYTAGTSVAWAQAQIMNDASFGLSGYCEYFIATSTGAYHADATVTAAGGYNMLISTINPGGGGGGTVRKRAMVISR